MLIWHSPAIHAHDVQTVAAHARGWAECLLRDDGKGSIVLCEQGSAPEGIVEKRAMPVFSAGRFGPEAGPWLFLVGVWTPDDFREEFCAWYQSEHGPMLLECRDWQGFQFLEMSIDRGCQFYVLHRLADRAALDSPQRKRSRATPWFRRLAKNKWFDGAFERILCHRSSLLWINESGVDTDHASRMPVDTTISSNRVN
jgi:hypothetical protein